MNELGEWLLRECDKLDGRVGGKVKFDSKKSVFFIR